MMDHQFWETFNFFQRVGMEYYYGILGKYDRFLDPVQFRRYVKMNWKFEQGDLDNLENDISLDIP